MADSVKFQERNERTAAQVDSSSGVTESPDRTDRLSEIVVRMRRDATDAPRKYLDETQVPFGGE